MKIVAGEALTDAGWRKNVAITVDGATITAVEDAGSAASDVDILLPAPANLHSHAFQRAMAGLTEAHGGEQDDFWSWREVMYTFLQSLTPDDVAALAAGVQMETLEAGFASIGEFHYVHNQPGGDPYDDPAEMSAAIAKAAADTGIGLTLLPVLYMTGGMDGRALEGGQRRFGADLDHFAAIHEGAAKAVSALGEDCRVGVAPHSLRAVPAQAFATLSAFSGPFHIHVAEQTAEVEAVKAATGAPPVARLMQIADVDERWTLIHATHATAEELGAAARKGAVAGLCPLTESNLGDGIVDAPAIVSAGGAFGVGSDSNVRISLVEELRTLDYSQRLALRRRNPLATRDRSSGRVLWEGVARGGAQALGRGSGTIAAGALADLVAVDGSDLHLAGLSGDRCLDAFIFAGDRSAVRHVWSAGRHVVKDGVHVARETIAPAFHARLQRMRSLM
ncbi:MAG: formimidoylglutamate deiminase [Pseudomonadota bacterium]